MKYFVIFMLLLISWASSNKILGFIFSKTEKYSLPHYEAAKPYNKPITKFDYNNVLFSQLPGTVQAAWLKRWKPSAAQKKDAKIQVAIDKRQGNYYFRPWGFQKIDLAGKLTSKLNWKYDERWKATGSWACFSCGCSCYMYSDLHVQNNMFYKVVTAKDYALRADRQGIYVSPQPEKGWIRITPKTDRDVEVSDDGCFVRYKVVNKSYEFDSCAMFTQLNKQKSI